MSKELLMFKATWCGPCKSMEPTINDMKAEGFPITTLDVEQEVELAKKYNVRAVPTTIVLDGDEVVDTLVGAKSRTDLESALKT